MPGSPTAALGDIEKLDVDGIQILFFGGSLSGEKIHQNSKQMSDLGGSAIFFSSSIQYLIMFVSFIRFENTLVSMRGNTLFRITIMIIVIV